MRSEQHGTRHDSRPGSGLTRGLALALMLGGIPLAGACDGDNAFTGDSVELLPRVTNVVAPQVAGAGDVVNVRVDASGSHGISNLVVSLRGAVTKDTSLAYNPPRTRLSEVLGIHIPAQLQDTLLIVQASVIDQVGNSSQIREGTVVVFGPPTITGVSTPTVARAGDPISVRVTASGSRKISLVDMAARGAIVMDSTIAIVPPRNSLTQDVILFVPTTVADTLISLALGVRDEAGESSETVSRSVPLAIEPPTVALSAPATAHAGMNMNVEVSAQAVRQVSEIRLELRGAFVSDKTVTISPTQSSLTQIITVAVPGDVTTSELQVRAIAVDRGGAVAYSGQEVVTIPLGPPVVLDVEVPSFVKAGNTADVRVRALGDRPLTRVNVWFRGAIDSDKVFTVNPQRMDVIQDASVAVGSAPKDSVLIVSATVTDLSGAVSEVMTRAIPIVFPPPDTGGATVAAAQSRPFLEALRVTALDPGSPGPVGVAETVALPTRRLLRVESSR
ncbi:MAG: hypothetical protein PVH00_01560 [Gemmatimonadota bacterium]